MGNCETAPPSADEHGQRLFEAIQNDGSAAHVQELLEQGASVNYQPSGGDGWTPLRLACYMSRVDVCRLLMDHGADPNIQDEHCGRTALHDACKIANWEVLNLLLPIITEYENNGHGRANVNVQDSTTGYTPLHEACLFGHLEVVERLIQKGADICVQTNDGSTPLQFACFDGGSSEVFRLLLENGANVHTKSNNNGETAFHRACDEENREIVQMLMEAGADMNAKDDKDGKTPLHIACEKGNIKLVQLLTSRGGANVHAKTTSKGLTPLQVACERNHFNVVWFLVRQYPGELVINNNLNNN